MNQLDHSSQSNAASAEKVADASAEINGLAQTSLKLTLELNKVIYGKQDRHQTAVSVTPPAPEEKLAEVKPLMAVASRGPKPQPKVTVSENVIPFDEDFGKLGTTDGF